MKPITQTSNTSKIITTRTLSDSVLRTVSHVDFMTRINAYVNARVKERNIIRCNTKRTPATFEERADLNTPPAITDHVRELAQFAKNHNETATHVNASEQLGILIMHDSIVDPFKDNSTSHNGYTKNSARRKMPNRKTINGGYCEHHPCKTILFGGTYHIPAISNTNRADKPAFRNDSTYLFDILSEDYCA